MLVVGGAQAVNIAISIVRMKVLAVLLGPAGIGLLSIYNNFQGMVANTAGLGMGSSGVRQIAITKGEERELSKVRRVLMTAHLIQGVAAMLAVWLLRVPIAVWLLGDTVYATEVGLIGVAVLLALLSTAQTTLLQGLRRIGDLGRVTVLGALSATVVGLGAVWIFEEPGLIWFLLVQPLGTLAVALYFTHRLPPLTSRRPTRSEIWQVWKPMAKLGMVFMLGGLATTVTLLLIRSRITQELGLDAAGQFAAAWGITITYVGFLLSAMSADYFPRLTEIITDRAAATKLMNDQVQLGLAIGGPVLLLLVGLAPWVIQLLYSPAFAPAATLLQWQTVGNVFKLASWALSFSIVAAARGKTHFAMEISFNIVFLGVAWILLPSLGLNSTAVAFLLAYIVYFGVVSILAHRLNGFRWHVLSLKLFGVHVILGFLLLSLATVEPLIGAVVSVALALLTGLLGLRVVLNKIGSEGRHAVFLIKFYSLIGWPLEKEK